MKKHIFAIGDLAYYEESDKGNAPRPQIVQAAEQTVKQQRKTLSLPINNLEKVAYKGIR